MAVWCDYKELIDAVRTAAALTKKSNVPAIRGRILLNALAGRLEVIGTDLDVRAGTYVSTALRRDSVKFEREILVDSNAFLGVLKAMPKTDTVGLNLVGDHLQIGSSRDLFAKIPVFDAETWPAFEKVPEHARECLVDSALLRYGLKSVEFAAARPRTDPGRESLQNIVFDHGDLVASNGKRLAYFKFAQSLTANTAFPLAASAALLRILKTVEDEELSLFHDSRGARVWFLSVAGFVSARTHVEPFPDYVRLIPTEFTAEVNVETAELKSAIEIAVACQTGELKKDRVVELAVDGGGLLVTTPKNEWKTSVGTLLSWTGPERYRGAFKPDYILQAIRAIGGGLMRLGFNDPKGAAVASRGAWTYAFMPVLRKPK